mgnify:CR=1 FL=1
MNRCHYCDKRLWPWQDIRVVPPSWLAHGKCIDNYRKIMAAFIAFDDEAVRRQGCVAPSATE